MKMYKMIVIQPCRRCGSNHTGRILYKNLPEKEIASVQLEHLKRGEYVRICKPGSSDQNCFCADCGLTWNEDFHYTKLSRQERQAYIQSKLQDSPEEELRSIIYDSEHIPQIKRPHPIAAAVGRVSKNILKSFAYNMIYQPTIGTVKDIVNYQKHSLHPEQKDQCAENTPKEEI